LQERQVDISVPVDGCRAGSALQVVGHLLQGWHIEELAGSLVRRQQVFHLLSQRGISGARLLQESRSLGGARVFSAKRTRRFV